jgi:cyclic pyranopterin phosphate synthase
MSRLSHTDDGGKARMVDTSDKEVSARVAKASVTVLLNEETYRIVRENRSAKGDVLTVAKLAGIQAAKKTAELIPLCHQIPLDRVEITFQTDDESNSIAIVSTVKCSARTGVEMEALTACSVCALTVYDMLKAVQRDIRITDLMLLEKQGGKSGVYNRQDT